MLHRNCNILYNGYFCLEKFKLCIFLSRPRSEEICACWKLRFFAKCRWMSYLCRPQHFICTPSKLFWYGCRCVRKVMKIACLRIKLLTVSNVFWYCEIAQIQYYSFFSIHTYRCIVYYKCQFHLVTKYLFTSPNSLVSNFNIVIITPFIAVLMVSLYGFLQQHS